jgi:hypothetical protein
MINDQQMLRFYFSHTYLPAFILTLTVTIPILLHRILNNYGYGARQCKVKDVKGHSTEVRRKACCSAYLAACKE